MPVLRSIEAKLESLFEGVFGRAFRTNVQPVELARKLVKEMDEHRNVSVSRVYVPNEYSIYLSTADREQFSAYEAQLCDELGDYLSEHARRESYVLLSPPEGDARDRRRPRRRRVRDRDAHGAAGGEDRRRPSAEPGATMIYKPSTQATEAASPVELGIQREVAVVKWDGKRHEIAKRTVVIGRSKDADIQVADPNVSRQHAEIRQEGTTYWLVDLDSTNGVEVNGQAREAPEAGGRVVVHDRVDGADVRPGAPVVILASAQVETTLLALKLAFLVLLYLFIWRIVRAASRDVRLPQESMIIGPQQAAAAGLVPQAAALDLGRLVVLASPALGVGDEVALDSHALTIGRGPTNDVPLATTSTPRRGTCASSRGATASGSRTSARRTARSSTGSG